MDWQHQQQQQQQPDCATANYNHQINVTPPYLLLLPPLPLLSPLPVTTTSATTALATKTATGFARVLVDQHFYRRCALELLQQLHDVMSPAFLTAIAVILCLLFRLLNVNSQALKPALWCMDGDFLDSIYKIAPLLREP